MFVLFMRTVCRIAVRLFTFIFKLSLQFSSYENDCIQLSVCTVQCTLLNVAEERQQWHERQNTHTGRI